MIDEFGSTRSPEHYDDGVRFGTSSEMISEIKDLRSENEKLRAALEQCLIGGDDLANLLIYRAGAGFSEAFPIEERLRATRTDHGSEVAQELQDGQRAEKPCIATKET